MATINMKSPREHTLCNKNYITSDKNNYHHCLYDKNKSEKLLFLAITRAPGKFTFHPGEEH